MRSGSKRFFIGLGAFVVAATMTVPSFAAKKAVSDEELDLVTAAGQPVVIDAGGSATVSFSGTTNIAQLIGQSAQSGLRALILNNVAGENQTHNGVNISASGLSRDGTQFNIITQSWGAIADFNASVTAAKVVTSATDCNTGALICKGTTSAVPFAASISVLSRAADQIISVDGQATVTYNPITNIAQDISDFSQTNLIALVVNNVAGINQVANGINIGNSGMNVTGTAPTASLAIGFAGGNIPGGQHNTIDQFRGTPINFR